MVWLVWQTPPRQWIYWNLRCDLPRTRHQAPSKWHKGNLEDTGDKAGDKGERKRDDRDSFSFLFCINLLNFRELIRNSLAWLPIHPITSAILLEKVLTSLITSIGARSLSISSWENWPPYWILKVEEDLEERWISIEGVDDGRGRYAHRLSLSTVAQIIIGASLYDRERVTFWPWRSLWDASSIG